MRQNGLLALWRGNGAMMIRVVPYSAITFMTFRPYEKVRARTRVRAGMMAASTRSGPRSEMYAITGRLYSLT